MSSGFLTAETAPAVMGTSMDAPAWLQALLNVLPDHVVNIAAATMRFSSVVFHADVLKIIVYFIVFGR